MRTSASPLDRVIESLSNATSRRDAFKGLFHLQMRPDGIVQLNPQQLGATDASAAGGGDADIDFLRRLLPDLSDVLFSELGSESDFGVQPLLLDGPLTATSSSDVAPATWMSPAALQVLHALQLTDAPTLAAFDAFRQHTCDSGADFVRLVQQETLKWTPGGAQQDELSGGRALRDKRQLAGSLQRLADYAVPPFVQLLVGGEELRINPIPVLWLGTSPLRPGRLIGLMTAVVWT